MNLSELVDLIKKNYLYLSVGIILIISAVLVFIYFDNPRGDQGFGKLQTVKFDNRFSSKLKVTSSVSLAGNFLKLANVYKTDSNINPATLASKLGIFGQPKTEGGTTLWSSLTRSFSNSDNSFSYDLISSIGPKAVDENQAFEKAKAKLKELGLVGGDVTVEKLKVGYLLANAFHVEETTAANFNEYVFEIGAKLDNLRLVTSQGSGVLYRFYIGVDGEIKKIEGFLRKLNFVEKSTYPVKHTSTVVSEVENGKATIVNINNKITPNSELKVSYNKGEIVYYLPVKEEDYLQPTFLITSSDYFGNAQIAAVTAALKDESYK